MSDVPTSRPSIGRWLIAMPMMVAGLPFALVGLVTTADLTWLLWMNRLPSAYAFHGIALTPGTLAMIGVGLLAFGLALIACAWLLIRRREGRESRLS